VPAGIRRGSAYFPELESLRGLAIVLVFVFHADGALLFPLRNRVGLESPLPLLYVWAGHTGVTLFFVLSAFLLSLPFLDEAYGGRPVSRRQFYQRRALRILPLYWVAVVVATILTSHALGDLSHGLPYLAFLQSKPNLPTAMRPFSGVWWSLATEVQFYVVLPLLPLLACRARRAALALGAYAVVYVLFMFSTLSAPTLALTVYLHHNLFGRAPLFLSGIGAAWLWRRGGAALRDRLSSTRWMVRGGADALLLLTLVALSLLLQWVALVGFWQAENRPNHVWHVAEGILWATILLLLLAAPLRSRRLVVNPVLGWVGLVSYSLFLIHVPAVTIALHWLRDRYPGHFTRWNAESLAACAVILSACLLLSSVTYWAVERPFLRRKARLAR
jgi:peptidoglycan/LPS O-acetylase OafA/YrhL